MFVKLKSSIHSGKVVMKKQNETEKDVRAFAEKLGQFDLQELRELSANALTMRDEALKKWGEGHRVIDCHVCPTCPWSQLFL